MPELEILNPQDLLIPEYEPLRCNRWILVLKEIGNFWSAKKLSIDFIQKTLTFELYEPISSNYFEKLNDPEFLLNSEFKIKFFDPTGSVVNTKEFKNLVMLEHTVDLDYSSADLLTHKFKVQYK